MKSPSYKIGNSTRNYIDKQGHFPGPGSYTAYNLTASNRPKSPTWSMGKSIRDNPSAISSVPGPGNYEWNAKVGEGPKVIIYIRIYLSHHSLEKSKNFSKFCFFKFLDHKCVNLYNLLFLVIF